MARSCQSSPIRLCLEELEERVLPSNPALSVQNFDSQTTSSLPDGWSQWSSNGSPVFVASSAKALSGLNGMASISSGNGTAQAWLNTSTVLARGNFAQGVAMGHLWNEQLPKLLI